MSLIIEYDVKFVVAFNEIHVNSFSVTLNANFNMELNEVHNESLIMKAEREEDR